MTTDTTYFIQVLISQQGVGKGMILSTLLGGIFEELGLHVTNFSGVVDRFNGDLAMKSFVLIDEGMFFGDKGQAEKMKTRKCFTKSTAITSPR